MKHPPDEPPSGKPEPVQRGLFDFDGFTYNRQRDQVRLNAQLSRVFNALLDGKWHTLGHIQAATGDPQASISARFRDLRKPRFGAYTIERRYVGKGLWEYRMILEEQA